MFCEFFFRLLDLVLIEEVEAGADGMGFLR